MQKMIPAIILVPHYFKINLIKIFQFKIENFCF